MKISVLSSGSEGNCSIIQSGQESILIDAGISAKRLFERILSSGGDPSTVAALIISHDHDDHISSAGVVARKLKIPVFIHRENYLARSALFEKCEIRFIEGDFFAGGMKIVPFPISHDGTANYAYNIISGTKKITHLTDIGVITTLVRHRIKNSDLIVLESNHDMKMLHDGPYPWYLKQRIAGNTGHLSNDSAGALVAELADDDLKNIILAHLSKENNDPGLAYESMIRIKENFNMSFDLTVASQKYATEYIEV
jgi:phosphoribosyl 1,2-cyclic phosphodiesterase